MPEVAVNPVPFFVVIGLYIVLMAGIGIYATRHTNTMQDYFVLSGKAGFIVSGIAYATTQYSMGTFLGTPGTIYGIGYAGMGINVPGVAFSLVIPAIFIGRRLVTLGHREGFLTLSDYLSDRYENKKMSGVLGVMMLCFLIPMMGAQILGAGILVNVFTGLPNWVGIVGMGVIVIGYCMTGGMRGAMMTDVVQGVLMFGAAIAAFVICLVMGGGMSSLNESLAKIGESFMTFPGANGAMPWGYYVSNILLWSFFTMGQPQLFTKFFAMKDHKTMFRSVILATVGMMLTCTMCSWAGVLGYPLIGELSNHDYIIPVIIQRGLPPVVASVFIAGIAAAGMSTIDGVLITATSAATRDIYQKFINPKASDEFIMKISRYVTIVIGVIVIIFGCAQPGSIFIINTFAFAGMAMFIVPVLFGMYWKKATCPAAIASIVSGVVTLIACTKVPALKAMIHGFHAVVPAAVVAAIVMFVVSLATQKYAASEETLKRHMLVN
ncbi:sodium:solute symporter family protein [Oscillibacter sp. MSJ-2]|uniref:Sodium:solute symporter family protein n=1 Tax=Dysosmobacter acutus TaxID=2841504 RepID=A0ABS6F5P8_9FIRM|nr:sodium:solute symporter family protein [Dysosmobacter acutus]MBU5625370.1 sodium:solute symporter family protein [Dysosmobacter acutus]